MVGSRNLAARAVLIGALMCAAPSGDGSGQVPWESPQALAPGAPRGASLMLVDFGLSPFDGTGLLLTYRGSAVPRGFGLRLAATLPGSDRMRFSGGVDGALPLFDRTRTFPLDVILTSGIGGGYGDYAAVAIPLGLSAGRSVGGARVGFAPYTSARVVVEARFGEARPREEIGVDAAAEIGADLWLRSASTVRVRGAVSLGDRRALAIGVHVGGDRVVSTAARQVRN